jgi:hypothetical protein
MHMPDQWVQAVNVSIIIGGAIILLAMWFFLSYWMFRNLSRKAQLAQPPVNVPELAMLLQTIRGLVQEQKALAADFNRSVDKRVTLMREVIQAFSDERERLAAAQAELSQLQNQVRMATRMATVSVVADEPDVGDFIPAAPRESAPETDETNDLIDAWVGVDFANVEEEPEEESEPFVAESDEERVQSHEALGALLGSGVSSPPARGEQEEGSSGAPAGIIHPFPDADESRERLTFVRTRAYRFYDAGMTVSQIAQELGIGKGEVRLMLNLRERAE